MPSPHQLIEKSSRRYVRGYKKILPTIDNLPDAIIVRDTQVQPFVKYRAMDYGKNATATVWNGSYPDGGSLVRVGSSTLPSFTHLRPLKTYGKELGIRFNAADSLASADSTAYDMTTEDFVFEVILNGFTAAATYSAIMFKQDAVDRYGYEIRVSSATLMMILRNATGFTYQTVTGNLTASTRNFIHCIVVGNRNGTDGNSSRWYVDGVQQASGSALNATSASVTNTGTFDIGGTVSGDVTKCDNTILALTGWKAANLFTDGAATLTEGLSIAKARYKALRVR